MLTGHKKQWDFLKRSFESDQLAHAYLLTGEAGIGKLEFAKGFAEFINCKFPDLMIVGANEKDEIFGDGGEIKISQIREVQNFLSYKPYYGSFKVVIIDGAEKMNQEAQSCFLKTLEEPKGNTILFLVTSKPDILLKTIFSRCQTIKFFRPAGLLENKEETEKNKKILEKLIPAIGSDFAERFQYVKGIDTEKEKIEDIIKAIQKFFRHLILVKIGAEKEEIVDKQFSKYSVSDIKKFLKFSEEILTKISFTNANQKLALELLLLQI